MLLVVGALVAVVLVTFLVEEALRTLVVAEV
jgi:hypothetical protein